MTRGRIRLLLPDPAHVKYGLDYMPGRLGNDAAGHASTGICRQLHLADSCPARCQRKSWRSIRATLRPSSALSRSAASSLAGILITHHHADHVGGVAEPATEQARAGLRAGAASACPGEPTRLREGDRVVLEALGLEFDGARHPGSHRRPHRVCRTWRRCSAATRCSARAAAGCSRARRNKWSARWPNSRAAGRDARVLRPRVHGQQSEIRAGGRAATTPRPRATSKNASAKRARDEATVPSSIRRERNVNPFLRCDRQTVKQAAEARAGRGLQNHDRSFRRHPPVEGRLPGPESDDGGTCGTA